MLLADLLAAADDLRLQRGDGFSTAIFTPGLAPGHGDVDITDVEHDSRHVRAGTLYCAIPGAVHDGHDFVAQAIDAGAGAVLVERDCAPETPAANAVPQIITSDVRHSMPWLAAAMHGDPSAHLPVVGVTGTNGKTTITHMVASIATESDGTPEVIGTLTGGHTTPESTTLQRQLRHAQDRGADLVAIEVSSHALEQRRTDALMVSVAIFTNLTPDHLDYHETMENYFAAKGRLFDTGTGQAIIVTGDAWGQALAERRADAITIDPEAIPIIELGPTGSTFVWRDRELHVPIAGRFNIINATCAAEAARLVGFDDDQIARGLAALTGIPGRMERVGDLPAGAPVVLVDYSHTPDSLERALGAVREFCVGRVIVVFGCGGDRDRTKRPMMGRAAADRADRVIITSDNPRTEDPRDIMDQIVAGLTPNEATAAIMDPDRRAAIHTALSLASADDAVLVAGKGHEMTQTIGTTQHHFDDREVVAEYYEQVNA